MKKEKKKTEKERTFEDGETLIRFRKTLRWRLSLFVLGIVLLSGLITSMIGIIALVWFDKIPAIVAIRLNPYILMVILICACALISTPISAFFGKYYLKRIKALIAATKEVKKGNFDVRVPESAATNEELEGGTLTEMEMLVRNFNEMVKELAGIEMFRNDFINNFSHEFKTPIVSIRGFARELRQGNLDEEQQQEYAKIIEEESDRLAKLSISVLELSKLENQQIVTNKTEFYLDEQLRQCILLQEAAWSQKEIDMIPELDEVRFLGNEEMLLYVWSNLLSNAIKFTPVGGSITVRLREHENCVVVTVSDTGIGMSDEVKEHIFEKFYQGDKSHTKAGYGIGLTVVKRVIDLCHGKIDVESSVNRGSTFTVYLPKN